MNGVLSSVARGFRVEVDQSFGNCPRYIQLRDYAFERDPGARVTGSIEELAAIDPAARALIENADAFFVASYRSEEHTSELQSLMRISYAVFCLKKKKQI